MLDRLFAPVLTFMVLAAGSLALAAVLLTNPRGAVTAHEAQVEVIQLPAITVIGKRG